MSVAAEPADPKRGYVHPLPDGRSLYCWHSTGWGYRPAPDVLFAGYGNRSVSQLVTLVERWECHVADIRLDPRSERAEWSAENLRSRLGTRYAHIVDLGNLNHSVQGADIDINNLEKGIRAIRAAIKHGRWPLLLCACGNRSHCHRLVVARALEAEGLTTFEIHDWPAYVAPGVIEEN